MPSKSLLPRLVAGLAALAFATGALAAPIGDTSAPKPKQIVLISFDGAHDLNQWQRSRDLAMRTGARFTYFLSCVFLLTRETKGIYKAPAGTGRSNVGFAMSKDEVAARLQQIRFAAAEGHDVGSHGCGHFDGGKWSKADWMQEFSAFSTIVHDAYTINGLGPAPSDWQAIADHAAHGGFRAPYLSATKALDAALRDNGTIYNASGVSQGPAAPVDDKGLYQFALPMIPEGPSERRIIAMDYNLYVRHSGGMERPSQAAMFEDRTYRAFHDAFQAQYDGQRVPLQLGFHFTLMNDGAYWRALERFAGEVCTRADVACISYADYVALRKGSPATAHESTKPNG